MNAKKGRGDGDEGLMDKDRDKKVSTQKLPGGHRGASVKLVELV